MHTNSPHPHSSDYFIRRKNRRNSHGLHSSDLVYCPDHSLVIVPTFIRQHYKALQVWCMFNFSSFVNSTVVKVTVQCAEGKLIVLVPSCVGEVAECDTALPHQEHSDGEREVPRTGDHRERGRPSHHKSDQPYQAQRHISLVNCFFFFNLSL